MRQNCIFPSAGIRAMNTRDQVHRVHTLFRPLRHPPETAHSRCCPSSYRNGFYISTTMGTSESVWLRWITWAEAPVVSLGPGGTAPRRHATPVVVALVYPSAPSPCRSLLLGSISLISSKVSVVCTTQQYQQPSISSFPFYFFDFFFFQNIKKEVILREVIARVNMYRKNQPSKLKKNWLIYICNFL